VSTSIQEFKRIRDEQNREYEAALALDRAKVASQFG